MILTAPDLSARYGLVGKIIDFTNEYISVAALGAFVVAALGTFLLVVSRRLGAIAADFRDQADYHWWLWLIGHGGALLAFLALSWPVFEPVAGPYPILSLPWLLGWLVVLAWVVSGIAILVTLLLSAAPAASWLRLARQEKISAAIAGIAGAASWAGGTLTLELWTPLTRMTLWGTELLLSLLYADVYVDPASGVLGVNSFAVEIAPACSGYEGMALITVFVAVYLWLFRAELKLPDALLLFPIGIVVIWVANVIRITALVAIGASISADVAIDAFHSQAGWIAFSVVALGMIALSHRYFLGTRIGTANSLPTGAPGLALALLTPMLALIATSMLTNALSGDFPVLYPLGVLVTAATLWHFRAHYTFWSRLVSWEAVAIGVAVWAVWLLLVPGDHGEGERLKRGLTELPAGLSAIWLFFRVFGSVVTVPLAEELAFRGYLIRKLTSTSFEKVNPGQFTWLSFTLSSVLFGLLHDNFLAGTAAGAGFALALYRRGQLSDSIVAHITSNALIACTVLIVGRWALWT